jgi:hypothetical protein
MTAEEHNRTLATLHFIYGAMHGLTLLGLALLIIVIKLATPAAALISTLWMAISVAAFVILFLLVGLVPVIAGYGFRGQKRWVKPLGLALAFVSLINIPIGTALGIYTFKFFRSAGGVKLYGGKVSTTGTEELGDAMRSAQPLMNLAKRSK